ncbi:excinuclease ABC subunit UvrA [Luteibaculum oceani]|uniref:UvrABC system protein A n=1 Tax=Luteibaculum oceani TaxID=1294296 RepID=A0A5C6UWV1_9FLAO|nr:excinuclease ABC subunit UvrA [Luteibaculum oceani]TXC77144.1 excinuclease ABC subunit UvrA [Luteibaculum oceani]
MFSAESEIDIVGAKEHNLKNISLKLPRNKLVVITGLSGSGKSSLAFDTLYAEGQRRYIETFSSYARQFIGNLERPQVDQITGLSPVISIEQKTVSKNPRSTVGTITELYDFLRLLFARTSTAISHKTGEKMVRYSEQQILALILDQLKGKKVDFLAPVVQGRKGHYRELLESYRKKGFVKARIDGELHDLNETKSLDRFKIHDVDIVIDRLKVDEKFEKRIKDAVSECFKQGKGILKIWNHDTDSGHFYSKKLMCPTTGIAYPDPEPNTFSFNSPYGYCSSCKGLGIAEVADQGKMLNPDLSISKGGLLPLGNSKSSWVFKQVKAIVEGKGEELSTPIKDLPKTLLNTLFQGTDEKVEISSNSGVKSYKTEFEGIENFVVRQYQETDNPAIKRWARGFLKPIKCPSCEGKKLKKVSLHFKIDDKDISEVVQMDLNHLDEWLKSLPKKLDDKTLTIGGEILAEIQKRLGFLLDVGLGYLTLDRSSKSLSGGEAQRIRLATQIGTQLVGVLYILDEPSIGLHQRDNKKLIESLKQLRDLGNTVLVVEHDKETMEAADHIVDIGPKAGVHGGKVVAQGTFEEIIKANTLTSSYLNGNLKIDTPKILREGNGKKLELFGASGHNLKDVNLSIPLGKLVVVSGVSGSGKSSLINQTLYPALHNHFFKTNHDVLPHKKIKGIKNIDKVIDIDQSPIGRTPRSNPATYTKVFDEIRKLFAEIPEAKIRGYKAGRFSFNTKGGRCETCEGGGIRKIEMNFLPDVFVNCETCQGKRYDRETLEIRYKGHSISDILDMTINRACEFFEHQPRIARKIQTLVDVGLGYLTLGQQSTTLSGGEAQRIKLASELSKKSTGNTLYILDEPTTGLHFEDIRLLISVINRLVDQGNSVIVIEHNLDIIKVADHIIDMGPEGGFAGGTIVAEGTPKEILKSKKSVTAPFLKEEYKNH